MSEDTNENKSKSPKVDNTPSSNMKCFTGICDKCGFNIESVDFTDKVICEKCKKEVII